MCGNPVSLPFPIFGVSLEPNDSPTNHVNHSLAYAELYLALAILMSRFELENYETTFENDIKVSRDFFIGVPKAGSKGVRAKIVGLM